MPSPWTPEDALSQWEGEELEELRGFRTVMERLDPENGLKFLILFLLHEWEPMGYEWSEIGGFLADPDADLAPGWAEVCYRFSLSRVVPRHWSEVCERFRTPPPKLTKTALKQWYHRAWEQITFSGALRSNVG
ncbi:MAG: hypothetical protein HYY20_03315 [Candidatus Tectomicrobia bacterium]|uniref:Uncharacterized protein n=1 Tax=Tectimicrobiota bacterium TaxID=2528274 RepID=A0A932CM23_UNCTE|nr:hypothetical protein [Candidatus Tectomicrobia bacterium]